MMEEREEKVRPEPDIYTLPARRLQARTGDDEMTRAVKGAV